MSLLKRVVLFAMVIAIAMVFDVITTGKTSATDDTDPVVVNLDINNTISISCSTPITMSAITGTGQSTMGTSNRSTCTVITNNSAGYDLKWVSSGAGTMVSGGDSIAAYTPAVADTPETWSVAGADSEWGGHVGKDSTTVDTGVWGALDTYAGGKWLNIATTNRTIATRNTETAGDTEYVYFGAEVGASKFQPAGTYTNTVTMTASTK
jgi:hypothetical protein